MPPTPASSPTSSRCRAAYGENKDIGTQQASPDVSQGLSRLRNCDAGEGTNPAPGQCDIANGTPFVAYGTVTGDITDRDHRKVWRVDGDLYADFFGKHHFRAGYDFERLKASELTTYTGSGYRYDFRVNQVLRYYYENAGAFKTNMRAYYLQDSWSLLNDRINLQLGIRNDRFRNFTENGDKYYDSGDNWAPRIGATFDVFGDQRTKLNAFYGKYYLPIATNTNIRLGGSETYYLQSMSYSTAVGSIDANGDGIPDNLIIAPDGDVSNFVSTFGTGTCPAGSPDAGDRCRTVFADGLLGPTDTLVAEGLKPSESDEYILGLSHRFGDGWTAGVDYVRRRLIETLEDVAIDAAVLAYCAREGIAGCENTFYGFHQYVLANPGSDITVRLDGDCDVDPRQCEVATLLADDLGYPKAVRKYDAIQFTLDKAFNGFYGFNFNYVYTKLRGNFEGGVKSDNNQTDTGLTQDFDQPGLGEGAYGDLANGRKHSFKLYGHVKPLSWLDVGVNVLVESPRKFSCYGNYGGPSAALRTSTEATTTSLPSTARRPTGASRRWRRPLPRSCRLATTTFRSGIRATSFRAARRSSPTGTVKLTWALVSTSASWANRSTAACSASTCSTSSTGSRSSTSTSSATSRLPVRTRTSRRSLATRPRARSASRWPCASARVGNRRFDLQLRRKDLGGSFGCPLFLPGVRRSANRVSQPGLTPDRLACR